MNEEFCPVAEAAKLLGDKWMLIILRDLAAGPRRFKALEHTVTGISPSVLASRLRDLEHQGMVTRTSYNEIPPRVEYALSEKGHDALAVIEALRAYGEKWLGREGPGSRVPSPPAWSQTLGRSHAHPSRGGEGSQQEHLPEDPSPAAEGSPWRRGSEGRQEGVGDEGDSAAPGILEPSPWRRRTRPRSALRSSDATFAARDDPAGEEGQSKGEQASQRAARGAAGGG